MLENAGKIAHFIFTYEKVDKTDSLQPSGCNGLLVLKVWLNEVLYLFNLLVNLC